MAPRKRLPLNKGLPDNLYWTDKSQRWLKYIHPQTKKSSGMGSDKRAAITAAKKLNALLMTSNSLVDRVIDNSMTMIAFIDYYYGTVVPGKNYKQKTLTLINGQRKHLEAHFGKTEIEDIGVRDCDALLDTRPPAMANNYRKLLKDIFKHAIAKGYYTQHNPAEMTLQRLHKKERLRMTREEFDAIRGNAEPWCQIMMDIALITLQREGDILNFKYDDIVDDRWNLITQKTGKPISIPVSEQLRRLIEQSRADGVISRFVIHKRHPRSKRGKEFGKININSFNAWFLNLRKETGIYDHLPAKKWPSFHEIRALGTKLYRDAGIDPQPLLAHENIAMTDHYDSGHKEVRYEKIEQVMDI